ncbi:riboflavin synthase [Lactobacillus corticis]|uniref:Riboflavin synthase n=1 Tax=Lactobacillus corticis TaxID=2201249 RepID=A0A916QFW8_9LACO|nr:riboflavin synthase [Lactobacillus corticis]GFZ26569.1 riboflavin synthase subunit alpha [Lactobacillus corticis]
MFSGLVTNKAVISAIKKTDQTIVMTVETQADILQGVKIGDSIAINGCCLTVESFDQQHFTVTMMPQTYNMTTFKDRQVGDQVNLERSLRLGDRFDGHIVSGHVDGTVKLLSKKRNENALELTFPIPPALKQQIISQGSIAINGTSLTIMHADGKTFSIGLIPHTQDETNLAALKVGDAVNIETDVIAKYVAHDLAQQVAVQN